MALHTFLPPPIRGEIIQEEMQQMVTKSRVIVFSLLFIALPVFGQTYGEGALMLTSASTFDAALADWNGVGGFVSLVPVYQRAGYDYSSGEYQSFVRIRQAFQYETPTYYGLRMATRPSGPTNLGEYLTREFASKSAMNAFASGLSATVKPHADGPRMTARGTWIIDFPALLSSVTYGGGYWTVNADPGDGDKTKINDGNTLANCLSVSSSAPSDSIEIAFSPLPLYPIRLFEVSTSANGLTGANFFVEYRNSGFYPCPFTVEQVATATGSPMTAAAKYLIRVPAVVTNGWRVTFVAGSSWSGQYITEVWPREYQN